MRAYKAGNVLVPVLVQGKLLKVLLCQKGRMHEKISLARII